MSYLQVSGKVRARLLFQISDLARLPKAGKLGQGGPPGLFQNSWHPRSFQGVLQADVQVPSVYSVRVPERSIVMSFHSRWYLAEAPGVVWDTPHLVVSKRCCLKIGTPSTQPMFRLVAMSPPCCWWYMPPGYLHGEAISSHPPQHWAWIALGETVILALNRQFCGSQQLQGCLRG